MRLYKKIIFLICLCMNMGGCVSLPTYSDPRVDGMADSQIAILENRRLDSCLLCVARITDADGKNIPLKSSEQHPAMIKGYKKHSKSIDYYRASTKSHTVLKDIAVRAASTTKAVLFSKLVTYTR